VWRNNTALQIIIEMFYKDLKPNNFVLKLLHYDCTCIFYGLFVDILAEFLAIEVNLIIC